MMVDSGRNRLHGLRQNTVGHTPRRGPPDRARMSRRRLVLGAFTGAWIPAHGPGLWWDNAAGRIEHNDLDAWIGIPSNDPSVLISALAAATTHPGLTFTSATLQEHPFNFARKLSTLDHLSRGRMGWNVVTSYADKASRNFGLDGVLDHDERYVPADEYLDVAHALREDSTFADFGAHVVPVLRQWGLAPPEPPVGTLREPLFPGRGPHPAARHPARAERGARADRRARAGAVEEVGT